MKRRVVSLMGAIAAVGVFTGVTGMLGVVWADTPGTQAQKSALPAVGWGEPKDGLQIGLFPQSRQKTFQYGDSIILVMRARNVGADPIALTVKPPDISSVTLGENGRLVLQTLGGGGKTVRLRLAPGETQELPGGRYTARIVAPGDQAQPPANMAHTLALLPGEYHVECSYPLWIPDAEDPNRATAHRAKPGDFLFTVQKDGKQPSEIQQDRQPDASGIVWGTAVNGLQGGLHRVTEQELAALPADQRKAVASDEILTRFYLRNATDKPLRLTYHDFSENDASFWIKDAQGDDHPAHSVFYTGLRALSEKTLQPGERVAAGWGRLKFQTQEHPGNSDTPLLVAAPGQYTLKIVSSVRFAGMNGFDMTLVSAAIPFTIKPQ